MFLKKPARLEQALRDFRAIALLSVFSKLCTAVLVDLLHEEREPIVWKRLHVGAERGVNCEHMQALLTNILQRHWEWQEDRRTDLEPGFYRYNTLDVAKPSVLSRIPSLTGAHGHVAALLAEMQDVQGSACFENCDTEFGGSRCIRQGGVEAPVLWGRVAKYVPWKPEEKWKARFGGENDNEYVLQGMVWADYCWLLCDNKEGLVSRVNEIIAELLDLGMEPKLESLWWRSTHQAEEKKTMRAGDRGFAWDRRAQVETSPPGRHGGP